MTSLLPMAQVNLELPCVALPPCAVAAPPTHTDFGTKVRTFPHRNGVVYTDPAEPELPMQPAIPLFKPWVHYALDYHVVRLFLHKHSSASPILLLTNIPLISKRAGETALTGASGVKKRKEKDWLTHCWRLAVTVSTHESLVTKCYPKDHETRLPSATTVWSLSIKGLHRPDFPLPFLKN